MYIKLDKKLVIEAKELAIKEETQEQNKKDQLHELTKWLDIIEYGLMFFERIRIESLCTNNVSGFFLYDDGVFSVDTKALSLSTLFEYKDNIIVSKRLKAYIKEFDITIDGSAKYDLKHKKAELNGSYDIANMVSGFAKLSLNDSKMSYELNTSEFKSMDFLKKLIDIKNPNVSVWIYENVKSNRFLGSNITGMLDLKNPKYEDLFNFRATLEIFSPSVKFNPKLHEINAKKIEVNLQNNSLFFTLYEPSYQEIRLDGSSVWIQNLFTSQPILFVNIKTVNSLDDKISNILKAYNINLPLRQQRGKTDAELNLSVNLDNYDTTAIGRFETKDSFLKLNELEIATKSLKAELNNSQVYIKNSEASLGNILAAKDINMNIDTKRSLILANANIKEFNLSFDSAKLVEIKNKKVDFEIDFSKDTTLSIKEFGLDANFKKEMSIFELKDLSLVSQYSPFLLEQNITNGMLTIKTQDFKRFDLDANIKRINLDIAKKNGERLNELDLLVNIDAKKVKGKTKDNLINFEITDTINLKIKDLMLLIDSDALEKKKEKPKKDTKIYIEAKNSDIMIGKRRLLANNFKLFSSNNLLSLELTYKNSQISINTMGKYGSIYAKNLDDFYLNQYFKKEIFFGGTYNIYANIIDDIIKGTITTEKALIKNLTLLNNIVAFIDTIPSLVMFKKPGFSADGYEVESGKIEFGYSQGYFVLEDIMLNGPSIDIKGKGIIDTNNEKIDLNLRLLTLKNLSNIIGSIPIIGYIIMGDDKSISTDIKVSGNLEDPKIESQIFQDTIKTPLKIIERIIKTPSKLME